MLMVVYKKLVNEVISIRDIFRFLWEYDDYEKRDSINYEKEITKFTEDEANDRRDVDWHRRKSKSTKIKIGR